MASNSIAPSQRGVDLYPDGPDWKLSLYALDGTTQVASVKVGEVDVGAAGEVDLTNGLDLRALGGEAAHELVIEGAGEITVILTDPLSPDFPAWKRKVANGDALGMQVEKILVIGAGITRVQILWGGRQ